MELMIARISKISPGNDNIQYWVNRDCASKLSDVVTRIVNDCLSWCCAICMAYCSDYTYT